MKGLIQHIKQHKEAILLTVVLLIAAIAHGYNMFQYPYYENDEGVYMSQAWSIIREGKLAPYTYWYDHAPAGWMLIALWVKLTGGFFTFGTSIDSGRAMMLVIHLASSLALYFIAKRITKRPLAGIVAIALFSLSPLGIYFQRRVLLDNIMIFWVLISVALMLKSNLKFRHIVLSAIAFAVAVLTKENAVFFSPVFLYLLFTKVHKVHKSFAIIGWLVVSAALISTYALYALLKNEFFPVGFLGDTTDHVSLLSTLQSQLSRGSGLPFWNPESDFYGTLKEWVSKDAYLIPAGLITLVLSVFASIKERALRVPTILACLFVLFLIRGGLVIDFYVIPLIPLLALLIGVFADVSIGKLSFGSRRARRFLIFTLAVVVAGAFVTSKTDHFILDETSAQISAINWVKEHAETDSNIVIDNSLFVDLRESGYQNSKVFANADWFWKVEKDTDIRIDKLENDWKNIDYIVLSHEMVKQMRLFDDDFLKNAFINSTKIVDWSENSRSHINLEQLISTNGDWMRVYKVQDTSQITLAQSWRFYKSNFIHSYGQVVDQQTGDTTSEGQSYAMLRALWMDDRDVFDGVWNWTKDHMQHRQHDRLLSWHWGKDVQEVETILDPETASDADIDIALALAFAYRKWGDLNYLVDSAQIVNDIWENEVVVINGNYYLTAGTGAKRASGYLINPSYISPGHFKVFSQIDKNHDWEALVDSSYSLLNRLNLKTENPDLPPNWVVIDTSGGIRSAEAYVGENANDYGYDAFRTFWRVALDAQWFDDKRAHDYLASYETFMENALSSTGDVKAIYTTNQESLVNYTELSTNTAPLAVFSSIDTQKAGLFYKNFFEDQFEYEEGYWGEKDKYYDQNWAWFATALYTNQTPNVWSQSLVANK